MSSIAVIVARLFIVAPFLAGAVLAGLDYSAASAAFAEAYPQFAQGYPVILGLKALLGLVVVIGLPTHRIVAALLALAVLALTFWQSPFWHTMGAEELVLQASFLAGLAQAGGLLLIAAMPKGQ